MSWETLTTDDVLALFNDSEQQAYDIAKGTPAGDGLAVAVDVVVNEVREAISGRDISLGPDGTIPSGFKKRAISAARWQFLLALPSGKSLLSDERKAENERFQKLIDGIQDGSIHVVPGLGGPALPSPEIKPRHRHFKLKNQEGL